MVRRFLCLGAILLLIVLGIPACNDNKPKKETTPDPDGSAVPRPASNPG